MTKAFFIGAPKCGTSTLYNVFKTSSSVRVQEPKETHFFSHPEVSKTYYKVEFVDDIESYQNSFIGNGFIDIDFSPSYLRLYKHALPRIKKFAPDAKIVILLREPVSRAKSHYLMDVSLGYQSKPFLDAIKEEKYYKEYIENSLYSEATTEYLKHFKEVYITTYEELFNSEKKFKELTDFLQIEEIKHKLLNEQADNKFRQPRSHAAIRFLRKSGVLDLLKKSVPDKIYKEIKKRGYRAADKPNIDTYGLEQHFKEDIKNLEGICKNLELGKWWNKNEQF
ncbi:sulfotransferase family protein [Halopseudomonas pachastrellae]|uniref:sulfotransferase family protein n=1 Tax=Halopseudomonas pachastrellae TaxID=254161 RepID=UPI003D7C8126